jgi:hypothetical protein
MNISITDALPLFTNEIVAKYSDVQKPKSFGRSFFTEVETASKLASVIAERGLNLVASDVARGSRGNLNVFDKSTEKLTMPPYFNEFFNMVELDSYDALNYGGTTMSAVIFGRFLDDVAAKMNFCMDKIDRRYELQCWQALLTGIVTLNNGQNITYGRQAGSLVDPGAGNYWADASVDPFTTLERGATWLNETGKMEGNTINVTFGGAAYTDYINNPLVKARNLQLKNNMDSLVPAQRDAIGKTYHGETSVGSFNYRFFTYTDFYENEAGVKTKYMDDKKVVLTPEINTNVLTYTAVPQLLTQGQMPVKGKFLVWDAISNFKDAHFMGVKSAGIPILVGVDRVYTEKVVTG